MKKHIAEVKTKKKPWPNIPEAVGQARNIQIRIKGRIAVGQPPKNSWPSWVEITPRSVLVPVIRWIE
jgi:hypothetical protein